MRLTVEELLLIDWMLSSQASVLSEKVIEDLMAWRDERERVWRALIRADLAKAGEGEIEFTDDECDQLLALIPTTFRWGAGEDVGYSLKLKLAALLWGDEETENHESTEKLRALFGPSEIPDQVKEAPIAIPDPDSND